MKYSDIAGMSLNRLKKAVVSGELSVPEIKTAYTSLRRTAMQRERRVGAAAIVKEFGNTDREYFRKPSTLTTTADLLRELADVNRYLKSKRSTITGLKDQRKNVINSVREMGFDVDTENYSDFIKFMNWFRSSEYSMKYDSDSEEVAEVFNSEKAKKSAWKKAFQAFQRGQLANDSPVRRY